MNQKSWWVLPYLRLRYWSFQTLEYGFRKSDGPSPPRSAKNTPPHTHTHTHPAPGEKIEGILWTAGRAGTYKVNSVEYKKTNVNMTAKPTRLYLKPKQELWYTCRSQSRSSMVRLLQGLTLNFTFMLKTILKGDRIWKPVDTNTVVNLDLQTDHDKTLGWSETSSAMK